MRTLEQLNTDVFLAILALLDVDGVLKIAFVSAALLW